MSWDAFTETMLLLILASFIVERSLAVIFETQIYIRRFGTSKLIKPMVAIIYASIFVAVVDINLVDVMSQDPETGAGNFQYTWKDQNAGVIGFNLLVIVLTGIFIAGGSKASLKLFRDVMNIKSAEEANRTKEIKPAPADPVSAASAAAGGNTEAELMLFNMFEAQKIKKAT